MEQKINIAELLKCFPDEILEEELQRRNYYVKKSDNSNNLSEFNHGYWTACKDLQVVQKNWCEKLLKQMYKQFKERQNGK